MKLLHLADLHIGKIVNRFSMLEDQKYILDQVLEIADKEKPEVVIIAGDKYDRTAPSAEAVAVFDDFLHKLAVRKLKVMMISGNHDSAERIAYASGIPGKALLSDAGSEGGGEVPVQQSCCEIL